MMMTERDPKRIARFYFTSTALLFLGIAGIEAGVNRNWTLAGIILAVGAVAIPLAWFRGRLWCRALFGKEE